MRIGFLTSTRSRARGNRLVGVVAAIAILCSTTSSVTANADPTIPPESQPPAPTSPEFTAMDQAKESGHPVEVLERTTETSQVVANPDGRFTLTTNAQPVRAQENGIWHGIDLDLVREGDGRIRPETSAVDVAFSGGGSGPAITVAEGANKVDFYWPTSLPAPTMAGNVATYANVLPDVDLAVSANEVGFSQVLVVKNATAAANPAVRSISMSVATTGLTLTKEANDALTAVDAAGNKVFAGAAPVMWDSTRESGAAAPTATESNSGEVTPVDVTATTRPGATATSGVTDIVVTPDLSALTGPDVVYPLYIDPSLTRDQTQWIQVTTAGWAHYNATHTAAVGYCSGWAECGTAFTSRSFFTMNVGELNTRNGYDPTIYAARFYATQTHGAHLCTAEPVDLYLTGDFNSTTTWPGAAQVWRWQDQASSGAGDQCEGAGGVSFNVYNAIKMSVDQPTNWTNINFGLFSPNEGNRYQWKKFANNPQLVVDFNYPPNTPTDFKVSNAVYCDGKVITPDKRPTVSATATDNNNPALNLNLWMDLVNSGGTQIASMTTAPVIASGTYGYWPLSSDLADGAYGARGVAENRNPGGYLASPLSSPFQFTVHSTPPTQPKVLSRDYPKNYWGASKSAPGTFTVTGTDAVGAVYTFDGGLPLTPGALDCNYTKASVDNGPGWAVMNQGTATFQLPNTLLPGYHTITVQTFSDAHVLSAPSEKYVFYVAPDAGLATQRSQAESLAPQPVGQGVTISTQTDCCAISWAGGSQLRFAGTAVGQSLTLDVKTTTAGDYDLGVALTRSTDYGQIGFTLDGVAVGPANYDAYSYHPTTDFVPLGKQRFAANTVRKLKITTLGTTSTVAPKYAVGIDQIVLTPSDRTEIEIANTAGAGTRTMETNPRWSMGSQLLYTGNDTARTLTLNFTVPGPADGSVNADYALSLGLTKLNTYGKFTVKLDGEPLRDTKKTPVDLSSSQPLSIQLDFTGEASYSTPRVFHEPLGGVHLKSGAHVLEFEVSGSYRLGLDYLAVTQVSSATEASFDAAMNNNGVTAQNVSGDLDIINNTLSVDTLNTAGLGTGAKVAIRGATFTMPDWSSAKDNVIATGQTIPLEPAQRIKASAVGMLVTATCAGTPDAQAKITYAEPSGTGGAERFTTPMVPAVGDWITGTDRDTAAVLPSRLSKGLTDLTARPRIYAIFLPADPNLTLKQITLPRYGFMPGTECQPSLHVFAIAPVPVQPTVWVGGWQASADAAVPPPVASGFAGQTLRTVVHPNVTGTSVRVRLANPFTTTPVTINATSIGKRTGTGTDITGTPTPMTFGGQPVVTIPAGGEVTSEAVGYPANATDLVVSMHLQTAVTLAPHHPSATATTAIVTGNHTATTTLTSPTTVSGTYFLSAVDISTTSTPTDNTGTVVVIGDQTSGTAPSATGTWADRITGNLQPTQGLNNASRVGNTLGHWKLDGTLNDSAGTTNLTTAAGTTTYAIDPEPKRGNVATYNLATVQTTSGTLLNTQGSYGIAAWAKLTDTNGYFTAASQCGTYACAFYLQYNQNIGKWVFISPSNDAAAPASFASVNGPTPTVGKWTHLVGTYDAGAKTMSLYVDGVLQGSTTNATPFNASGPLAIGGGKLAGGGMLVGNYFKGSISNVWAFNRTVTADEAHRLAKDSPTQLTPPTTTDALDELNRTAYNSPRLQSVIVAVGTNDLLEDSRTDAAAIKDDLRKRLINLALTAPSSITNRTAPNGALVRMHLTTIPPLGLPATDPREQARRALNDDIRLNYSDYHADQVIDVANTVQVDDLTNGHLIKAAYLTNGKPNDAYHAAIVAAFNPGSVPVRF